MVDSPDDITPKDLQGWLQSEITLASKALELRIKDALSLVNAYTAGELTNSQLDERLSTYQGRWGEALSGLGSIRGMTDEQILARIDETQNPSFCKDLLKRAEESAANRRAKS